MRKDEGTNTKELPQNSPEDLAWLSGMLQAESHCTVDKRVRSTGNDPNYTPPPFCPTIKIEMIEKDVMDRIGKLVGQKVKLQNRKTSAGNDIYRVSVEARNKVDALLRAVLPYTVGQVRREKLEKLIAICDEYNQWLADGGRSKQAAAAARAGHAKRRAAKEKEQAKLQQQQGQSPTTDSESTDGVPPGAESETGESP